jgi:hypothetical protein
MKHLVLATVALSLLAAPAAFAQPQDFHNKRPNHSHVMKKKVVTKKIFYCLGLQRVLLVVLV